MNPSDAAWTQLISAVHASGRKAALAITGGGSGAIGELLRVPGSSRLLIEAQIPYDERALMAFLGFAPAQACSAGTAIAMAQSARARAARLMPSTGVGVGADPVGLGATAALVSDRPRRGEHRFHIAFANSAGIAHCTCVMAKGRRDRAAEEDLVSRAIVLWLARACGIAAPSPRSLLDADEHYAETVVAAGAAVDTIDQLLAGEHDRITVQPDGQMMLSAPQPFVLLPGSFNPMHEGHVLLARVAEELRQQPLAFEISVTNVDKPPLAGETVSSSRRFRIADASLALRPAEPVDVWIGASARPAIDRAARLAAGWIASPGLTREEARAQAELYRERCAAYGRQPGAIALRRDIYVGESSSEAQAVLQRLRSASAGFATPLPELATPKPTGPASATALPGS